MSKTHKIDARLIKLAEQEAERVMQADPEIKSLWLEQCATSKASDEAGGILDFTTDHDWGVAFWLWFVNEDAELPRIP